VITKQDSWRTKQELLRLRLRRQKGNTAIWGGVSYGPLRLKRRPESVLETLLNLNSSQPQ